MHHILLVLSGLLNLTAVAVAPSPQYFYSLPESAEVEYAWSLPECTEAKIQKLTGCKKFNDHQLCETEKTIELENVTNKTKKKFKLIAHVFASKEKCESDRTVFLSGDEE